jgi:sugar lactone lactonase YvrE
MESSVVEYGVKMFKRNRNRFLFMSLAVTLFCGDAKCMIFDIDAFGNKDRRCDEISSASNRSSGAFGENRISSSERCTLRNSRDQLVLIDFIPRIAKPGATVKIKGAGFSSIAQLNLVKFNQTRAAVLKASSTELIVLVPEACTTGVISVAVLGEEKFFSRHFEVVLSIASVVPMHGKFLDTIVVRGTGFNPNFFENLVTFNGVKADVLSATTTSLLVRVPARVGCGPIAVFCGNDSVTTESMFNYVKSIPTVTTFAGSGREQFDSNAADSGFRDPYAIAADIHGNIFVSDISDGSIIRKINPQGKVTTLETDGQIRGSNGIAVDEIGNVFVGDQQGHKLRMVTPSGMVKTLAGGLNFGPVGPVDGRGSNARFYSLWNMVIGPENTLYVVDAGNQKVRRVTLEGDVTTVGQRLMDPLGIAIDLRGDLYITDSDEIKMINQKGQVRTLAGGTRGFADGRAAEARFNVPVGIAVDTLGNIYVADQYNNRIRKISGGIVTTFAGGIKGARDGDGENAMFDKPVGLAIDRNGTLYVTDQGNHRIRKIILE